jgi:hypothetical protein
MRLPFLKKGESKHNRVLPTIFSSQLNSDSRRSDKKIL